MEQPIMENLYIGPKNDPRYQISPAFAIKELKRACDCVKFYTEEVERDIYFELKDVQENGIENKEAALEALKRKKKLELKLKQHEDAVEELNKNIKEMEETESEIIKIMSKANLTYNQALSDRNVEDILSENYTKLQISPAFAIEKLKKACDCVKFCTEEVEKDIYNELKDVQENGTENKEAALEALKRKEILELKLKKFKDAVEELNKNIKEMEEIKSKIRKIMFRASLTYCQAYSEIDIVEDMLSENDDEETVENYVEYKNVRKIDPLKLNQELNFDENDLLEELNEVLKMDFRKRTL